MTWPDAVFFHIHFYICSSSTIIEWYPKLLQTSKQLKPSSHIPGIAPVHPGEKEPVYRDELGCYLIWKSYCVLIFPVHAGVNHNSTVHWVLPNNPGLLGFITVDIRLRTGPAPDMPALLRWCPGIEPVWISFPVTPGSSRWPPVVLNILKQPGL